MGTENLIDVEKVKHIAHLARIGLKDGEVSKLAGQMSAILDYMKILDEVDTSDVKVTTQVTGLKNVTRPDEHIEDFDREKMLEVSALPKVAGQIQVKSVIKE